MSVGGLLLMLRDPLSILAKESRHGRFGSDAPAPLDGTPELPEGNEDLLVSLRTDLDAFSETEIACLMWAGAARMDIAIRRYLDKLAPTAWHSAPSPPGVAEPALRAELLAGQKRLYFGRS